MAVHTAVNDVTLSDILDDAAAGNSTYLNQTVTVTGHVVWKSDQRDAIVIYKNANVFEAINAPAFFITSLGNPAPLNRYFVGNSYTFTVTISKYVEPKEIGKPRTIAAVFPE